jgi:hypothetical protein
MKKVTLLVLAVGLFAGAAVEQAQAQGKRMGLSLNLGYQTDIWAPSSGPSFNEAWFTLDARLYFRLSKSIEISPELMAVGDFEFRGYYFYPGVMLNYTTRGLFVGAGIVLPIFLGRGGSLLAEGENATGRPAPKVNVGYRFGNMMVTAYFIAFTEYGNEFLEMNCLGATVGYRF